jgi:hypothetical protein
MINTYRIKTQVSPFNPAIRNQQTYLPGQIVKGTPIIEPGTGKELGVSVDGYVIPSSYVEKVEMSKSTIRGLVSIAIIFTGVVLFLIFNNKNK